MRSHVLIQNIFLGNPLLRRGTGGHLQIHSDTQRDYWHAGWGGRVPARALPLVTLFACATSLLLLLLPGKKLSVDAQHSQLGMLKNGKSP